MNSIPLSDAININRNDISSGQRPLKGSIGVFDSIQNDGRFVLYTFACQYERVIWLSATPAGGEENVKLACKRLGKGVSPEVTVIHVVDELADVLLRAEVNEEAKYVLQKFVKDLMKKLKSAMSSNGEEYLVVIDDMSSLSALLSEELAYGLLQCVLSLRKPSASLIFRAPSDYDQSARDSKKEWIDGISRIGFKMNDFSLSFSRCLVECCNVMIDVLRLESGFSREAHGRLLISCSDGWESFNYICSDHDVRAIRMSVK